MDLNIDLGALKRVALEAGKAGLPFIEQALTAAISVEAGPFGLLVSPALNALWPAINTSLGLAPDTPPDQTADKIASDPAAAQQDLAQLDAKQQFALQEQQQADATRLAAQAQQTALLATDQKSESWFARSWRPAAGWVCTVGLAVDVLILPLVQYAAAFKGVTVPPPPDATQMIGLLTAMLGLSVTRTATLASQDSVKKAIVAPNAAVKPPLVAAPRR